MKVTFACSLALFFGASKLVIFERLTDVYGFDLSIGILVGAFAQASLEIDFLIKATINYSSFELIESKFVAFWKVML